MTQKFESTIVAIEESKDLSTLSVENLLGSLQSHELQMKQYDTTPLEQAFEAHISFRGGSGGRGFNRGRGKCSAVGRGNEG